MTMHYYLIMSVLMFGCKKMAGARASLTTAFIYLTFFQRHLITLRDIQHDTDIRLVTESMKRS